MRRRALRRVPHPFVWILGLIVIIAVVLGCAPAAFGCDPNLPDCQLPTPDELADTGTVWPTWIAIAASAVVLTGVTFYAMTRSPR